jgi:hypothetical protein
MMLLSVLYPFNLANQLDGIDMSYQLTRLEHFFYMQNKPAQRQ